MATISHCSAQKAGARPWPPLKSSMSITVVHDAPTRGLFVCGFLSIVSTLLTDPCGGPRVCSVPVPKSQAHATTKSASSPARMALDVLDWITRRRRIAPVHSPWAVSLGLYEACIMLVQTAQAPSVCCRPSARRAVVWELPVCRPGSGPVASHKTESYT